MNLHCFSRQFCIAPRQSLRPLLPLPSPMQAHIWCVIPDEVKSSSLLNDYMEILSSSEKANVLSFADDQLKKRALLARALVRTTIARYQTNSDICPKSLTFKKNAYGKPEVEWQLRGDQNPPLHFNISHTSSLIACGISVNSPIGIDVEEKTRKMKNNILSFARRFLSSCEVDFLSAIPDSEVQLQEFIKLWTLKYNSLVRSPFQEAYVKALGKGFSGSPFKTFTIHLKALRKGDHRKPDNADARVVIEADDGRNWEFALVELAGSHYAAVCLEENKASQGVAEEEGGGVGLKVWKTVPFAEEVCMTGTDSVVTLGGLVKQLR